MTRQRRPAHRSARRPKQRPEETLRIIGGTYRGRRLAYSGDVRTRPMKDRTRQAVFNLLGPAVKDKHAIDLFAGTGALGLEALSRGAERATLIERHLPTAKVIRQNVSSLRLEDRADVLVTDAFFWVTEASSAGKSPWLVFCSPPYQFYVERLDDMQRLIENLIAAAPVNSYVVVEADERFNMQQLPLADKWKVRRYSPAMIAILGPIGACE